MMQSELWADITSKLNSCVGPKKSVSEWKKCLLDMKRNTKEKYSRIKTQREKTGGGGPTHEKLTTGKNSFPNRGNCLLGAATVG